MLAGDIESNVVTARRRADRGYTDYRGGGEKMSVLVKSGGGEKRNARSAGTVASCHGNFESLVGKVTLANATPETILRGTVRMWGNGSYRDTARCKQVNRLWNRNIVRTGGDDYSRT